ncbi:superinfection exclusion B family protein [Seohaeicola saemankumensis]|nr:superinfection exclusion B family protein [Seohaeicola saemankumensis]MCA0871546.1 superinfection exclusion B family protein [Seohaeicola saemankumensis]
METPFIFQLLERSSKTLWALLLFSGGLLLATYLGFSPGQTDNEEDAVSWSWIVFGMSLSLLLVRYVDSRIRRAKVIAGLDRLTQEECSLLKEAIHSGSPSVRTSRHSATAGHLVSLGVLVRVEGDFADDDWPYSIPDFVWPKVLMRKSDILDKADTIVLKNGKGTIEIRKS